jgi:P pilus assembly chaperone PapD
LEYGMLFKIKFSTLALLISALACLPLSAQAISISAFRIYLDADKPTTSFTVHNPDVEHQGCELKLTHYNFDENSELVNVPEGEIPANSASPWIRFSPQKFTLTPANSQTIRFTLRKKANAEPAEYRSYLVVDCDAVSEIDNETRLISIKPKLMHNVPVIVRNGNLDATISVTNQKIEDDSLYFSVERSGSRSVYADVALVNKRTDEVIASQTGFSIYPESQRYFFKLGIKGFQPEDLFIRVTENIHYGGNLALETDVQPK